MNDRYRLLDFNLSLPSSSFAALVKLLGLCKLEQQPLISPRGISKLWSLDALCAGGGRWLGYIAPSLACLLVRWLAGWLDLEFLYHTYLIWDNPRHTIHFALSFLVSFCFLIFLICFFVPLSCGSSSPFLPRPLSNHGY